MYSHGAFPDFLFLMIAQPRREDAGAAKIPNDLVRMAAFHDRQSADVVPEHFSHRLPKQLIRERHNDFAFAGFEHALAAVGILLQGA